MPSAAMLSRLRSGLVRRVLGSPERIGTGSERTLAELDLDHPERNDYSASRRFWVGRPLRRLRPSRDDVFVDFGSGMGRVVMQAARWPFARVIGVELSDQLTEVARTNLAAVGHDPQFSRVEFLTADARTYEIPDEMTVAFMFNPFSGEIFLDVLRNIAASLERRPRSIHLIYIRPVMHDAVMASGVFEQVHRYRNGGDGTYETLVYRSTK